ncbi:MAG: Gfo/Idh/MocA family oxidoreductase, partial [Kiritimatiellia bacterium]|nr:Gfo/Idh/MocA family oxidoreductase [Kiritimatiellia bacterium]
QMQASWRTDPKQSGAAGSMGDIGTHAANLAEYISGLRIHSVCADLSTFVKGRRLDDDGNVLLRFKGGAKGVLHASQISVGEENNLAIWVYGEKGGFSWRQEEPNELHLRPIDAPEQIWRRGNAYVAARSPAAALATRVPAGHPEGYLEAFANHYMAFTAALIAGNATKSVREGNLDFPGVDDGVRGMSFIEAVVASSKKNARWVRLSAM